MSVAMEEPGLRRQRSSYGLLGRLALMMFLQYFVQGAYLPIASLYVEQSLGFTSSQIGWFISALAIGPILAPFLLGQLVDRLFPTEWVMAFCHLVGGLLMLVLYTQTGVWPVIVLGTAYSILYVPTMMLSNSLAFQHLRNSELEFPWIRILGTLGYIAPAFIIEMWWLRDLGGAELESERGIAFAISGLVGMLMAGYCLTLPRTLPQHREDRKYAPGFVVSMLAQRDFLVLTVVSFLIAMAHQFIVAWTSLLLKAILATGGGGAYEQRISSLGQICEIVILAVLGLLIKRLGFKWTLVLGATAYLVRCLLFAAVFYFDTTFYGKLALAAVGQSLHGLCFGCFFAVGYMYVDRISPPDVRGSMQTIYGTFIVAAGFFVGGLAGGAIGEMFTQGSGENAVRDWPSIWLSCAALCAVCVALMVVFFPRGRAETQSRTEA